MMVIGIHVSISFLRDTKVKRCMCTCKRLKLARMMKYRTPKSSLRVCLFIVLCWTVLDHHHDALGVRPRFL